MKITELIEYLQEFLIEEGDVEVYIDPSTAPGDPHLEIKDFITWPKKEGQIGRVIITPVDGTFMDED